jgi:parallel beta-helix repeat protein
MEIINKCLKAGNQQSRFLLPPQKRYRIFRRRWYIYLISLLIGISLISVTNAQVFQNDKILKELAGAKLEFGTANGKTLYVGGSGPNNYSKIQDAIDNASVDDTVFVFIGTYYENVVIDKSLTLRGEGNQGTIIDGGKNGNVVHLSADGVTLESFKLVNSGGAFGWGTAAVYIESNRNKISRLITDNNLNGIWLMHSSNNSIFENQIRNNNEIGIELYKADDNIIQNNVVMYNNYLGLSVDGSSNTIFHNAIIYNPYQGISVTRYSNIITKNNIIHNGLNARGVNYVSADLRNLWVKNYWDRPRFLPYPILSSLVLESGTLPWIDLDWYPAKLPMQIE